MSILLSLPYVLRLKISSMISYSIDYKIEKGSRMTFFLKIWGESGYRSVRWGKPIINIFFGYFSQDKFRKIYLIFPSLTVSANVWNKPKLRLGDYIPQNSKLDHLKITSPYKCEIEALPFSLESLVFLFGGFIEMSKNFLTASFPNLSRFKFEYRHDTYEVTFDEKVLNNLLNVENVHLHYVSVRDLKYLVNHESRIRRLSFAIRKSRDYMTGLLESLKTNTTIEELCVDRWSMKTDIQVEMLCLKFPNLRVLDIGNSYNCTLSTFFTIIPSRLRKLKKLNFQPLKIDNIDCTKPFNKKFMDNDTFLPTLEHLSTDIIFTLVNPMPILVFSEDFRDVVGSKRRKCNKLIKKKNTEFKTKPLDFYERFFEFFSHLKVLNIDHLGRSELKLVTKYLPNLTRLSTTIVEEEELEELSHNPTIRTLELSFCNMTPIQNFCISKELKYLDMKIHRGYYMNEISEENLMDLSKDTKNLYQLSFSSSGWIQKCLTRNVYESFKHFSGSLDSIIVSNNILFSKSWKIDNPTIFFKEK